MHFTSLIVLVKLLEAYGEGTFDNPFLEDPNASKVRYISQRLRYKKIIVLSTILMPK